ncbi:Serine protease, subtilisin family [Geodermatophilus telluris]|uniref:Serine protease, subtilisin family n=1 Tax=Geodermatophilus telluris TaxID=1190417 RepID=A0A1G6QWA6_9ACTN|nr:S8 family serine peptidase [Geodermatophilus telluris]SDC96719.1 Serine protease, subtilisin family [Geodermatophilus telluris]
MTSDGTRGDGRRSYWAAGDRVELTPSPTFVAVREAPGGERGTAAVAERMAGIAGAGRVITLPDRGLVLVGADGGAAATRSTEGIRQALEHDEQVAGGPTVFETASAPGVYLVPDGEVIVKFREGADGGAVQAVLARHHAAVVRTDHPEPGALLVQVADDDAAVEAANALHEEELVEYAEPNFVQITRPPGPAVQVLDSVPAPARPVDDMSALVSTADGTRDGGLADPGFASQWGLTKIRAPEAWGISTGSSAISVAVVDEGNDVAHEDISYRLPGFDAYDGDNDPSPAGSDAHGTACAGIVSMRKDNGKGGVGVAPGSPVLPVRIAKGIGGGAWDTDAAKAATGIRTAVDRGADVLSNSYSLAPSTAVANALQYAATNGRGGLGCVMAAAAGNGDQLGVIFPARLSPSIRGLLAVGASNEWDQRKSKTSLDGENWWGSNWGPEVDLVAPGVHVYTTDITGAAGYGGGNYVTTFNGTSSATPHVAGVAALVLSVDPQLRGWEVEDVLKLTARDLGTPGRDDFTGFGRVDARAALEAASRLWADVAPKVEFVAGRAFLRIDARLFNPGINTVRVDSFTLRSLTADGTSELDRFEYRPAPGNVLLPRSGHEVRFNQLLFKANGTPQAWSYRWAASWTYTYWRPTAPGFPLTTGTVSLDEAMAGPQGRGEGQLQGEAGGSAPAGQDGVAGADGEVVRATGRRTITITID